MKSRSRLVLASVCLVIVVAVGVAALGVNKDRYADLQMFTKVLNLIEQHYVDEVDTKKLIYGGIKGMLSTLDPHTNFLPPDVFKEFKTETSGEFGGLGIEISLQDDILTVISPIEDTPAYKAGIKSGDKIVEIEGKSTKGMSLSEAVNKMRGKRGTPITISVWREGFDQPKKFTLEREKIKIKSIKPTDLGDGYLYARVTSFIERSGEDLKDALDHFEKQNGKIKGVVLDLRNNAGGLLDQAIKICNLFINEGVVVSTSGRNKREKEYIYAKKDGARTDFPMIVLMNEYSASASEIVAGALQDHKRAAIMGTRSFGKGSVQSVIELGDGAGLKLTVARYYTPSGRSIQAEGIVPDIKLDPVDAEAFQKAVIHRKTVREADIEGHLVNETDDKIKDNKKDDDAAAIIFWKKDKESEAKKREEEDAKLSPRERLMKKDYQVTQALNYLKAWSVFKTMGIPMGHASDKAVEKTAEDKMGSDSDANTHESDQKSDKLEKDSKPKSGKAIKAKSKTGVQKKPAALPPKKKVTKPSETQGDE